jgi:hypothetical protein
MTRTKSKAVLIGRAFLLAVVMLCGGVEVGGLGAHDAQAVVGRPLTPMSYAGVARRTTRRTVRRTAYYGGYGYGHGYGYGAAVYARPVVALPAGCTRVYHPSGYTQYACAGAYYRPYYDGPNLVYVQVH